MIPTRKVSQKEWAYEVERALKIRKVQREQLGHAKFEHYDRVMKRIMPIPYIVGGLAAFALLYFYGWKEFFKFFLSWVVSLTLIATLAFQLWKYYEKRL